MIITSVIILVSALAAIWAAFNNNQKAQIAFKPLTMILIIVVAWQNAASPLSFYSMMILFGLGFSTIGDAFLIDDKKYFIHGLISFLIGHLFYIAALYSTLSLLSSVIYLVYIVMFLNFLWTKLGNLKIPVAVYAIVLSLMSWFALSTYLELHSAKTLYALIGSIFFIASDSLLAFNKFKSTILFSPILILGTYFMAQWLIAISCR